jgi:peptidoglycan/xylan/chitin deacetylase (PgdA/CDA1 family)
MNMNVARILAFGLVAVSVVQSVGAAEPRRNALLPIPDKLVVLTFDDANKSDRTTVAGVLKKHGFGGTFYITEGLRFLKNKNNYTTWAQIKELDKMGFEIGNPLEPLRQGDMLCRSIGKSPLL